MLDEWMKGDETEQRDTFAEFAPVISVPTLVLPGDGDWMPT
jgi:hypothetical protein